MKRPFSLDCSDVLARSVFPQLPPPERFRKRVAGFDGSQFPQKVTLLPVTVLSAAVMDWANDLELPLEQIKEEVEMAAADPGLVPYQEFRSSGSWDSGVVLDSSTVLQMAEFQEVVDKLSRGGAPPPYQHQQGNQQEVVLPHTYQGQRRGALEVQHGGPTGPRSLPLDQEASRIQTDIRCFQMCH